jgi:hypothetical protein
MKLESNSQVSNDLQQNTLKSIKIVIKCSPGLLDLKQRDKQTERPIERYINLS